MASYKNNHNFSKEIEAYEMLIDIIKLSEMKNKKITTLVSCFEDRKAIATLNLNNWDVSAVEDMTRCFFKCTNLIELNMHGWDTSNVKKLVECFAYCTSLTSLDLSYWLSLIHI